MGFAFYENNALIDDRTVKFEKIPEDAADRENAKRRIVKAWDGVKSDMDGLAGIKLQRPDVDDLVEHLIKEKSHALHFELFLTKSEFRLDVVVRNVTFKVGAVRVPSEQEEYRNFLGLLNGWSTSMRNIVPDADFKKWNTANAKGPAKPTQYSDFSEMLKKSKSDVEAFREWAKTNRKAKQAFADIDKTAKAKPTDAARVAALQAINAALKDYYKSFK